MLYCNYYTTKTMRKKITEEFVTKAKKREIKKRLRMGVHGSSLRKAQPHAGKKITQQ